MIYAVAACPGSYHNEGLQSTEDRGRCVTDAKCHLLKAFLSLILLCCASITMDVPVFT